MVPARHSEHVSTPPAEMRPTAQSGHDERSAELYVPEDPPMNEPKGVPRAHSCVSNVHVATHVGLGAEADTVPAPHAEHTEAEVAATTSEESPANNEREHA